MKCIIYILSLSTLLASANSGCRKDTCNKEPSFQTLEAADTLTAAGNIYDLRLQFTPGQQLPAAYYRAATLSRATQDPYGKPWNNDFVLVQAFDADDKTLIVHLLADSLKSDQRSLNIHFIFPDRKDYIDCDHPGGPDKYYLDIACVFTRSGGTFKVGNFEWKEKLSKGGF